MLSYIKKINNTKNIIVSSNGKDIAVTKEDLIKWNNQKPLGFVKDINYINEIPQKTLRETAKYTLMDASLTNLLSVADSKLNDNFYRFSIVVKGISGKSFEFKIYDSWYNNKLVFKHRVQLPYSMTDVDYSNFVKLDLPRYHLHIDEFIVSSLHVAWRTKENKVYILNLNVDLFSSAILSGGKVDSIYYSSHFDYILDRYNI